MSERPTEPLDPELADLFAREGQTYSTDAAAKGRVLARVARVVALNPPDIARTPGLLHRAHRLVGLKALALAIASFGLGGAVSAVAMRPRTRTAESTPSAALEVRPATNLDAEAWVPVPPPPSVPGPTVAPLPTSPSPSARAPTASARPAPSVQGSLAREREVIDAARAALAHRNFADSLAASLRHEREWPHGVLQEEREVLVIQALVGLGRRTEADARAAGFRRQFPGSMLEDAVQRALEVGD